MQDGFGRLVEARQRNTAPKLAIERGWLEMHDSETYVKFTAAGADLFA
jgi:hypothetical protein